MSPISQALQKMRGSTPAGAPGPNPFAADPGLEEMAQAQGNIPLTPMLQSLLNHFGLLGTLRNQVLQPMVDPTQGFHGQG